jgi:hypothetical protein
MTRNQLATILILTVALCSTASDASAATGAASGATGAGLWVAFGIAYLTRRRAFGGWLFYYYLQLFLSTALTLLLAPAVVQNLTPSGWGDRALHSLFIFSVVPLYLSKLLEVIAACALLSRRYRLQKYVDYLRYTFLAQAVAGGVALFIEYNHFPENVPMTVMSTALAVIWYLYFDGSCRVDWVLAHSDREWSYEAFRQSKSRRGL